MDRESSALDRESRESSAFHHFTVKQFSGHSGAITASTPKIEILSVGCTNIRPSVNMKGFLVRFVLGVGSFWLAKEELFVFTVGSVSQ